MTGLLTVVLAGASHVAPWLETVSTTPTPSASPTPASFGEGDAAAAVDDPPTSGPASARRAPSAVAATPPAITSATTTENTARRIRITLATPAHRAVARQCAICSNRAWCQTTRQRSGRSGAPMRMSGIKSTASSRNSM